ncbi:MAG: polymer-forming cytoskeletal protein [Paludibacter sp.]|nr:polymer-forming cytoskeletal protein [Paludibacter sp.]
MAKEVVTNAGAMYNALTNGSKIVGKIFADSDFRIDGEVEGTINCNGKVVIGQKGLLKGSITCLNAEVVGTVEGDVNVSETLSLRSTAVIKGDVKTKILVVEPNAVFNGTCSMRNNENTGKTVAEK